MLEVDVHRPQVFTRQVSTLTPEHGSGKRPDPVLQRNIGVSVHFHVTESEGNTQKRLFTSHASWSNPFRWPTLAYTGY